MTNAPDRKTVLAFMAHPDDAEFVCAGTLIRLADAGWEVHIATATPGDCGTMTETPWAIAARRTAEAEQAAAVIHARYHCLDERDCLVVYDKPALRKTIDLFRRLAPSLVFTHAPKDYMMDHEMASLLARAASFAYGAPNISTIPVREGSRIPYLYYCDPTGGCRSLGCGGAADHSDRYLRADGSQGPNACLPCQPAGVALGSPRHGRVHRLDAAAGGDARRRSEHARGRGIRPTSRARLSARRHFGPIIRLRSSIRLIVCF